MLHKKLMFVMGLLVVVGLVLTACQPQTVEVVKTVEVEKVVKETQVVVETKVVEQTKEVSVEVTKEVERPAFTTPHPILGDLKVRQAMAYCTNKLDLIKAGYPLLDEASAPSLVMDTFIPKSHWAYAGDENVTIYPFDTAKGGALLDEAGWKLAEGADFRTNEKGETLALKFTTTTAAFRQAWAAVWEQQMKACGIQIVRQHVPSSWWFGDTTGLARRDFELGAYAWVGQADPGGQTLWACDQIPLPTNNWEGQNYMGWCNEAASVAIKKANNTLVKQERIDNYKIVQQAYTADVPALPLFNRTETFATAADLTGFKPTPGQEYYNYNVYEWERPGQDTVIVGFTQEPATLYTLVESAWVANLAASMVTGFVTTSLNYDFQAVQLKELPTLENGQAVNNDVEVKAGDKVYDASGNVVELANGVKVIDSTGATVEFTGSPVKMKQLAVTFTYRDDLKWSDGEPVKQADFELAYKNDCDKESGATTYITCDQLQGVTFSGLSYTATYKPGVQLPLYFLPPVGYYPSHRVIAEGTYAGKTLADVPAKDWATLKEIAENPIGVGPYVIKEWVKGEKIVYEANPYFFLGAPKTPNLVIKFVTAENSEAQLLGGEVDLLGSETLAGLTEVLVNAEKDGKVKTYVIPGATWEHIDFNLFVR